MNEGHLSTRYDNTNLAARIASYELAYKMQASAPEAVDLARLATVAGKQAEMLHAHAAADAHQLTRRILRAVRARAAAVAGAPGRAGGALLDPIAPANLVAVRAVQGLEWVVVGAGLRVDRGDVIGSLMALAGVMIALFWPRGS